MTALNNILEQTGTGRQAETVPKMVTVNELAGLVNISAYAIRRLIKADRITYFKSGTRIYINLDRFIDFLNGEQ